MRDQTAAPIDPGVLEPVLRPFERSLTLPPESYTSQEILDWEPAHFFEGSWVCVGRGTDLENPGDQRALEIGNEGILLVPVRIAEWHGWVFVNPSGDAQAFEDHVGNLDRLAVAPYDPGRLIVGAGHEYEIGANWKIVVENYLECYHCTNIHPELCLVTPPESGDRAFAEDPTGVWTGAPMDLREHAATMSLSGESLGVPIPGLPEDRLREVGYAVLYPNLLISPHPDYVMTHRLVPVAPNRTWIECQWLFPPEAFEREGFDPSYAAEFWDVTNREDWEACASVQRSAEGRGYRQGPLSTWEIAVYDAMTIVARGYLEGKLTPPQSQLAGAAPAT